MPLLSNNATSIQAIIIPVAVAFSAKPGDRLLIVKGVCIGLDGQHPPDLPPAVPATSRRKRRNPGHDTTKGALSANPIKVISAVHHAQVPLTSGNIVDIICPDRSDDKSRNTLRATVFNLKRRKILVPTHDDRKIRNPHLQLSTKGAKIALELETPDTDQHQEQVA